MCICNKIANSETNFAAVQHIPPPIVYSIAICFCPDHTKPSALSTSIFTMCSWKNVCNLQTQEVETMRVHLEMVIATDLLINLTLTINFDIKFMATRMTSCNHSRKHATGHSMHLARCPAGKARRFTMQRALMIQMQPQRTRTLLLPVRPTHIHQGMDMLQSADM